ncbi:MAG: hypothetical protein ABSH32_34605, partial [Bryobacteraceae bacterium]
LRKKHVASGVPAGALAELPLAGSECGRAALMAAVARLWFGSLPEPPRNASGCAGAPFASARRFAGVHAERSRISAGVDRRGRADGSGWRSSPSIDVGIADATIDA